MIAGPDFPAEWVQVAVGTAARHAPGAEVWTDGGGVPRPQQDTENRVGLSSMHLQEPVHVLGQLLADAFDLRHLLGRGAAQAFK
jgi:hypothetical protein